MPENITTAHGFKLRIMEANPGINQRYAERVAKRIKRQMDYEAERDAYFKSLTADETYEVGLRILGLHSDTTARDAITNIERQAA